MSGGLFRTRIPWWVTALLFGSLVLLATVKVHGRRSDFEAMNATSRCFMDLVTLNRNGRTKFPISEINAQMEARIRAKYSSSGFHYEVVAGMDPDSLVAHAKVFAIVPRDIYLTVQFPNGKELGYLVCATRTLTVELSAKDHIALWKTNLF